MEMTTTELIDKLKHHYKQEAELNNLIESLYSVLTEIKTMRDKHAKASDELRAQLINSVNI